MGYEKGLYLRPVEWLDSMGSYAFKIDANPYDADEGIYGNVLVLARQVEKQTAINARIVADANGEPRIKFYSGGANFTLDFTGSLFGKACGFPLNTYNGANTYTAPYQFLASWYPHRTRRDQNHWARDLANSTTGSQSRTGAVSHHRSSATVYVSTHAHEAVPDERIYTAAQATVWDAYTSLEYFCDEARISWPTTATDPSPAGVYYIPDWTALPSDANGYYLPDGGSTGNNGWLLGREGPDYLLTTSPDLCTFCAFDAQWFPTATAWLPTGRSYYEVNVDLHTQTAPTWTATSVDPPA